MQHDWENGIREGSAKLLAAINAARAGTHPGTPPWPAGLPRDTQESGARYYYTPVKYSLKGVPLLPFERTKHLLEAGATPHEIARIMRISQERADRWIARVKDAASEVE